MSSVGEMLRRERLRKDLSLEQISRETKISTRLLDAIESEHFELLPGGVFAKSFVRQYARFLGLDEVEMAAEVEKVIHPVNLPVFAGGPPEPAFKVPRLVDWEGGGRSSSSLLPALARVVAVMLVCSAVYAWWQRIRRPVPMTPPVTVTQKMSAPATQPVAPPLSVPPAATNPETTPKAEASNPAAPEQAAQNAVPPAESLNPAATIQVSLTADAEAWVQVWADGKSVMSGTLQPNEVKTIAAVEDLRIRTGNAGSLQVTVNGKPAGPLGPKGQIRNLEVTRDGVHILPVPPKPAPAPALEPL